MPAGDQPGIERLVAHMTRCPFSLSWLIRVTKTGQVVDKSEKDACREFPDPRAADLASGAKRNFQILSPLDFLAEFRTPSRTDGWHIPPNGLDGQPGELTFVDLCACDVQAGTDTFVATF